MGTNGCSVPCRGVLTAVTEGNALDIANNRMNSGGFDHLSSIALKSANLQKP